MSEASPAKAYALHLGVIALLFVLSFLLPEYYHGLLARIMVLAVFAMGYNMLFGYVGLLSLGHAMFFAAGLYGAGLAALSSSAGACRRHLPEGLAVAAPWRW
jgi:branched-chain amino acid transport system permease protein